MTDQSKVNLCLIKSFDSDQYFKVEKADFCALFNLLPIDQLSFVFNRCASFLPPFFCENQQKNNNFRQRNPIARRLRSRLDRTI